MTNLLRPWFESKWQSQDNGPFHLLDKSVVPLSIRTEPLCRILGGLGKTWFFDYGTESVSSSGSGIQQLCVNFTTSTYWLGDLQQIILNFSSLRSLSTLELLRQLNEITDKVFSTGPNIRLQFDKYLFF